MSRRPLLAVVLATMAVLSVAVGPTAGAFTAGTDGRAVQSDGPGALDGTAWRTGGTATQGTTAAKVRVVGGFAAAGNTPGTVVAVRVPTEESVSGFQFWYNDTTDASRAGPLSIENGGVVAAQYDNGTAFDAGDTLSAADGDAGVAYFTLDGASAPYVRDPIEVNVTVGGAAYEDAPSDRRDVATVNYHTVEPRTANGTEPLGPGTPVQLLGPGNQTIGGIPTTGGDGLVRLTCRGVEVDGDCRRPDGSPGGFLTNSSLRHGEFRPVEGPVVATAFHLPTANGSARTELSVGHNELPTSRPTAPTFPFVTPLGEGPQPAIDTLEVVNVETNETVYRYDPASPSPEAPPAFLDPATDYRLVLTNDEQYGTIEYDLTVPTAGVTAIEARIPTTDYPTSTVTGQVVDENGTPVPDAVVTAREAGRVNDAHSIIASARTDADGVFALELPESAALVDEGEFRYALELRSSATSGDTPEYYPTVRDNGGDGLVVREERTVLPALTIERGGRLSLDVVADEGPLPAEDGVTEVIRTTNATGQRELDAASMAFRTFSIGQGQPPARASVSIVSPTTSRTDNVTYRTWAGDPNRPEYVCAEQVAVADAETTATTCELGSAGYVNLSVDGYESVIERSTRRPEPIGDEAYFAENELVIRNASTGNVTGYVGPDSVSSFLLGTAGETNVTVPVPPGEYTLELRPAGDGHERTAVDDDAAVSVTAGEATDVTLDRGREFVVVPREDRFEPPLLTGENTLAVSVFDPATEEPLTDGEVSVYARLRHLNGTLASERVELTYNDSAAAEGTFDETAFAPGDLGVDAGGYRLEILVERVDGDRTYTATEGGRVLVRDFPTRIDLGTRTAGPGETLVGTVRAYDVTQDPPEGIDTASAEDVRVALYDRNGNLVGETTADDPIENGEGSVSVTMPDEAGTYRLVTAIEADDGRQGVSASWIEVSDVDVDARLDKDVYAPNETVAAAVRVRDATGDPMENASVEATVGDTAVGAVTDADGIATVELDPGAVAGGEWDGDQYVTFEVAAETDAGIVTTRTGAGFGVRALDLYAEPTERAFDADESATVDVYVPPSVPDPTVAVTAVDGDDSVRYEADQVGEGYYQVDLGSVPAGRHTATVTVSAGDRTETETVDVRVREYSIGVRPTGFQYAPGESITADVSVRTTDGTPVADQAVTARLYAAESPPRQVDAVTARTDDDGRVRVDGLASESGGEHILAVEVDGQVQRVGVLISDVNVTIDAGEERPEVAVTPGETGEFTVDATAGGSDVPDGSTVVAVVNAYDEFIELDRARTTDGSATLSFPVPDSVNARSYGLRVGVRTPDGRIGATDGVLEVTGDTAVAIEADTDRSEYRPGETATFSALVTRPDGTPVPDRDVTLTLRTPAGNQTRLTTTATTDENGRATYEQTVPAAAADGEYTLRASLTDEEGVQDFDAFRVSSFDVDLAADQRTYETGETVTLTVAATDDAGDSIDASAGTVRLVLPDGSTVDADVDTSGTAPYEVPVALPEAGTVGSVTVGVRLREDGAVATDSTVVTVEAPAENATLSAPGSATAGETTTVELNATVDADASLAVFSPGTGTVILEREVTLNAGQSVTESVTFPSAGTYLLRLEVPSVGTTTELVSVDPADGNAPALATGPSLAENATAFTTGEDVYVRTDRPGLTATVLTNGSTETVPLNRRDGDAYYGVLPADHDPGVYLVRLDSRNATGIDDVIVEVTEP